MQGNESVVQRKRQQFHSNRWECSSQFCWRHNPFFFPRTTTTCITSEHMDKIQPLSFASKELCIMELQFLKTYCTFLKYPSNWCVTQFANNSFIDSTSPLNISRIVVLFRIEKTNPGSSLPKISTKMHSRIMMILVKKLLAENLHDSIVQ